MNTEQEQLFLCKPCAEEMKSGKYKTVEEVKYVQSAAKKTLANNAAVAVSGTSVRSNLKSFREYIEKE